MCGNREGVRGRGACMAGETCMAGGMHGRGHAWRGGGQAWQGVARNMAIAAGGTHPSGMHSCYMVF